MLSKKIWTLETCERFNFEIELICKRQIIINEKW